MHRTDRFRKTAARGKLTQTPEDAMSLDAPKLKSKDAPDLGTFDWEDPFRLNDQLTEEERMLRDAARSYAQEKLQPRVVAAYREEATDPAIFREMGAMGLLLSTVIFALMKSWMAPARQLLFLK